MDSILKLQEALSCGATFEEALLSLREQGFTPIQTIRAICEVKKINLGEAKEIFSSSKAWQDVNKEADKLHQNILDALENENSDL